MANGSIVHLVASTDRRGAETFAVDLSGALAALGWGSETVALAPGRSGGLDLEPVGDAPLSLRTLQRLRRRTRGANVVVAHGSTTLPACALALGGPGQPFVYRNIGDPYHWATSPLRRLRTTAFLARAAQIVALNERSGTAMRELYRVPPRKLTAIPTGVSSRSHQPAPPDRRAAARLGLDIGSSAQPVVLTIGALSPEKGVDLAIGALADLDDAILVVAGDGPELAALERRADRLGVTRRVRFTGSHRDLSHLYAAADVVLLPSRTEGLPAVAIEAGMRGLPVVATDVGYVADIVEDGVTGFVVSPGDPRAIAAGIVDALAHPEIGGAARTRCVLRFDLETVAARWDMLLTSLLDRR
jgi:glycosyltransferase involved in cell wall biosynthesis